MRQLICHHNSRSELVKRLDILYQQDHFSAMTPDYFILGDDSTSYVKIFQFAAHFIHKNLKHPSARNSDVMFGQNQKLDFPIFFLMNLIEQYIILYCRVNIYGCRRIYNPPSRSIIMPPSPVRKLIRGMALLTKLVATISPSTTRG